MRIYKSDGSFIDIVDDTEFGWKFDHIPSTIQEYCATTAVETTLKPEGVVVNTAETQENCKKFKNIDVEIPDKQQIANLIQPYSVENKILLAVVHYAKYQQLIKSGCMVDFEHLRDHSTIKFLIDTIKNDNDLEEEIRKYHNNKDNNKNALSLMTEVILSDLNCDLNDLNQITTNETGYNEQDLSTTTTTTVDQFAISDIYKNIGKICEETYDIRLQIEELKKGFQDDQNRVEALIRRAQTLEKHLREHKFLDELMYFLNGDLDKITPKQCPFKILLGPITNFDDINLII